MSQYGLSGEENGGGFASLHFSIFQCLTIRNETKDLLGASSSFFPSRLQHVCLVRSSPRTIQFSSNSNHIYLPVFVCTKVRNPP